MADRGGVGPVAPCKCGHEYRHHFGDGPCLAAYTLKSGKLADKTVCPCTSFEAAGGPQ